MKQDIDREMQASWRKFISQEPDAVRIMDWLRSSTPGVDKGAAHEMTFDAGVMVGYMRCLGRLDYLLEAKLTNNDNLENN